jgi:5-methylcytosine-specific restriction endonuclease McrA
MPTLTVVKRCSHAGCNQPLPCKLHTKKHLPKDSSVIYQSPKHRRWRTLVICKDPVCVKCKEEWTTTADHILPLEDGGDWSLENGQGLCTSCHSRKTAREKAARRILQKQSDFSPKTEESRSVGVRESLEPSNSATERFPSREIS